MTFAVFLLACAAAAATGLIFQPGAWYSGLRKPSFTPPNWVFPLAWTTLYLLMAWSATRLAALPGAGLALALWSAQIALNTLWTPVFFGARRLGAGMAILSLLWLVVAALIVVAFRMDWVAGALLLPYLAWLTLAGALNFRVWRDNPQGF
ncbi:MULTISPECIES: tryptophan-rich sensory protein TspO [unclassified Paracoccus (in: a-proteobacteria)]|uniref:tryptophan-rich sensory protein TspO n=1 Tax=unclassified Paracoccus (in: a-proteobacteria) TaxID=2688777 RepID=UPI0012B2AB5E|nr:MULTISPECIES: TspO/MBR family protein [unclassified Paracoccus (in: a-proteobacteria)]UXU75952.1 tryptophan-rich sensory protein [Paracoccus sp. SMMA_5]UXU81861.1 tryptophan-rich sensory protein [Paracoccus sp. SMMA_5_TC]